MAEGLKQLPRGMFGGREVQTADIADGAVTSAKIAANTIANADIADNAITNPKIADGEIRPVKRDRQAWQMKFEHTPLCSENDGTVASGATGATNLALFTDGFLEYHIKGAGQTLLIPTISASGLLASLDLTDDEGVEYCPGITAQCPLAFTIGTSLAFYAKLRLKIADVSGTDDCAFGFRKQAAYTANLDDYTDFAALNVILGAINIETALNNAATTTTDTTNTWIDAATKTLEVYVSAAGVVTYKIDGVAPSVVAAFTFDATDVVVPFFYFLHATTTPGALHLISFECGYQADA